MQGITVKKNDTTEYLPLKLRPAYKTTLWGGSRLKREFGKTDAPESTAESWELSAHPDGMSRVDGGVFDGMTLAELGTLSREKFWGRRCKDGKFPLLVKFIDSCRELSIQVHPSDETAEISAGEEGKAEMWYVVDCKPQSYIYYGLSRRITEEEFRARAENGSICSILNRVPVAPGDVFYILPGTIHAIGAGILIAEIQQSSNTTFRIYDYRRTDAVGKERPLQLERAAMVADLSPLIPAECRVNSSTVFQGFTMAEMFSCRYFRANRLDVHSEITFRGDGESFRHLLCVSGCGEIFAGGRSFPMGKGESWFIPAAVENYTVRGNCRVLISQV